MMCRAFVVHPRVAARYADGISENRYSSLMSNYNTPSLSFRPSFGHQSLTLSSFRQRTEYAQVNRMLGNGRCESKCFDGTTRLCHIRGKLRKKVWVNAQDIVLVGLREYQDDKADIILKYSPDEARNLIKYGEIPDTTTINENTGEGEEGEEGDDVVFDFEAIDEI